MFGVNEDGGRFYFCKLCLIEQMVSFFVQGQDQVDKVSFLQQGIEIVIVGIEVFFCLWMLVMCVIQDWYVEFEVGVLCQCYIDVVYVDDV